MGLNRIKFIRGSNNSDCIQHLYFMDRDHNIIAAYDPFNLGNHGKELELQEHEEIVGIYGVYNRAQWFSSLGFIVKVRSPWIQDKKKRQYKSGKNIIDERKTQHKHNFGWKY